MADTFKVLGQAIPAASTLTAIYTCPAAKGAVIDGATVCNQGTTQATFRLSIAVNGAADTAAQYVFRDVAVAAADTYMCDMPMFTIGPGDVVRVFSSTSTMSFNLFGMERDQ